MSPEELTGLRKALGLTQLSMGAQMGLSKSAYAPLETGKSEIRYLHGLAAERVAQLVALNRGDAMILPAYMRGEIIDLYQLIAGKPGEDPQSK